MFLPCMREEAKIYSILFLLFLLLLLVFIAQDPRFTGGFWWFGTPQAKLIRGETLFGTCNSNPGELGRDFARNVLYPHYGCVKNADELCEIAARDGFLPGDVQVNFACKPEQVVTFKRACVFELTGLCTTA